MIFLSKFFRPLFSLRGGLLGLCFVYIIYMLVALYTNVPSLLLKTSGTLLGKKFMSLNSSYHAFGIIVTILAIAGLLFNEKHFVWPLLAYDSIIFIFYIATFGFLLLTRNSFLNKDKNLTTFICHIGFCYFAVILEYNFYCDLVKKTKQRPEGVPESVIILPSATNTAINSIAILQQFKTESHSSGDTRRSYHYVYGLSEAMAHFIQSRSEEATSSRLSANTSSRTVLYNAETECIFEIPPPPYKL